MGLIWAWWLFGVYLAAVLSNYVKPGLVQIIQVMFKIAVTVLVAAVAIIPSFQ